MLKSSMCALGNSSVETKTHKGLKKNEKAYLTSALLTCTSNPETLLSIGNSGQQAFHRANLKRP